MTPPLVSLPVLEAALADIFTNPFARESIAQAFADNDPYCAALVLTKLVERRVAAAEIATTPERPALPDPQAEGGTPARVSLDRLVALAGETP